MTFEAHLKRDLLLVFVNDGDSQPETDNNEIDRRARCGEWCDPAALTAALISDPGRVRASDPSGFSHFTHGIIYKYIKILLGRAFRAAGPALIIDEGTNILGRQQSLERIRLARRFSLRTVNEDDDRYRIFAHR